MTIKAAVGRFRAFNRYYTRLIGLLDGDFLDSPYTLTEVRVIWEIANTEGCTAKAIRASIGIDSGYLSRTIDSLARRGLVMKTELSGDRRYRALALTKAGQAAYAELDARSDKSAADLVGKLSAEERAELALHMGRLRELLDERGEEKEDGEEKPR